MSDTRLRFRIGLFVLTALVMLAGMIWLFGGAPNLFKQHSVYTITFHEAPGLAPGAKVRRSGIHVGEVKSVDLDDLTGEVRVVIMVETKYSVRHNDKPTLVQALIGGGANIDLIPSQTSGPDVDVSTVGPDEVLTGVCQTGVAGLLDRASDVVPTTRNALEDARRMMTCLEQMRPLIEETVREYRDLAKTTREAVPKMTQTVEDVQAGVRVWTKFGDHLDGMIQNNQERVGHAMDNLNDALRHIGDTFNEDNQRNLAVVLQNVRTSSENLDNLTKNTDDLMKESRTTVKRINDAVVRADQAMDNIQDATKPLADRTSSITKNLDEASEKLNALLTDTRDILKVVWNGDGTLRKLATDPDLYNNVDESVTMLLHLLPRVERILKDAEVFSDKLARHPELIGAGGILQPSNGLKR
jgi:phospholipid/cholesterol/gamma-HCH transport system substrate-binding protein